MDKDYGKNVLVMNKSAKRLSIVITNLDGLVWQITDDSPNLSNSPPQRTFPLYGTYVDYRRNYANVDITKQSALETRSLKV